MEPKFITPEEAVSLLNEGEQIHTFRNPNGFLIGADHDRDSLIERLHAHPKKIQIGGEQCRKMNHALIVEDSNGYLFIETNEEKLNEFDPIKSST